MQAEMETRTVEQLVTLFKAQILKANPEYQRGVVWSNSQKKKLIDSVMRGYPLPLIYLHYIKKSVAGMTNEGFEVIDGQQRIQSLVEFAEGAFKLFDPIGDAKEAKFPSFIKDQPCPWGGRDIHLLDDEIREKFLKTELAVVKISTEQPNEVRDLFVRLQSGLPLNNQETRDALPGEFTEFILRLGGKPQLLRYPGHDFFTKTLGMKPLNDRGKTRQLAAQISMLFFKRRQTESGDFSDISSQALNEFYYENLDFSASNHEAQRLLKILDKLSEVFPAGSSAKLHGHDAIHLVLLVDSLWDEYTPSWQDSLPSALDQFLLGLAESKKTSESNPDEYWMRYGQWTRTNSDKADRIAVRHRFYLEKMLNFVKPVPKDKDRLFGEVERTILFYQQGKKCLACDSSLNWRDCEIHHVEEHSKGGKTSLENGAAVHKGCHPKGAEATAAFAKKFQMEKTLRDFF